MLPIEELAPLTPEFAAPAVPPVALILPRDDGRFDLLEGFEPGAVDCELGEVEDPDGTVVDAVAWRPEQPARWWLQHGQGAILGAPELLRSSAAPSELLLVETPAEYFARHRRGQHWCACVVNWAAPLRPLFDLAWRIRPETEALTMRLRQVLRDQWSDPSWLSGGLNG